MDIVEILFNLSGEQEIDKLNGNFQIRIPERLENEINRLSPTMKKMLNRVIMNVMAFVVHMSKCNPGWYLKSDV